MGYVIQSGKYETGTEEQQIAFRQLFGENSLYCFDMYFHWYNLIHELGHCFINQSSLRKKSELEQEMFANEFAVGYYRYAGEMQRLNELKTIIQRVVDQMPSPVPEEESFLMSYEGGDSYEG